MRGLRRGERFKTDFSTPYQWRKNFAARKWLVSYAAGDRCNSNHLRSTECDLSLPAPNGDSLLSLSGSLGLQERSHRLHSGIRQLYATKLVATERT